MVDSRPEPLLAAQILFSCLYADMAKQKLNLFQLAAGNMTEPGASSPQMPHAAFAALYRIQDYAESIWQMLFWR